MFFSYGTPIHRETDDAVANSSLLSKILVAGYPVESVTAVKAVADQAQLNDAMRTYCIQNAIWAVTTGDSKFLSFHPYVQTLYEYALSDGTHEVFQKISVLSGLDADGQLLRQERHCG